MADGAPELVPSPSGTQVRYRGRPLYRNHPIAAAEARAAAVTLPEEAICIVASPLLGYGISTLHRRLPESSTLLFVEADPALLAISDKRLEIHSPRALRRRIRELPDQWFLRFRRVWLISLNGGYRVEAAQYRDVEALVHARLQRSWQNKITTIHMGRLWITNIIANVPQLPRAGDVSTFTTNRPVAVVGAGPSLDRTVHTLARHRPELFILTVDTAYQSLLARGIRPDALCVVEAQHANLGDVLGTPIQSQIVWADIASYPGLLRRCSRNRLFFFSSTFGETSLLARLDEYGFRPAALPPLGSVGATAVELARRITTAPILLFGLDFAFAHGKTHARGTPQARRDLRIRHRLTGSDPSPFTLSARTIPLAGLLRTTSELVTYNRVTAELGSRAASYDLGDAPEPLGVKLEADDVEALLERQRDNPRDRRRADNTASEVRGPIAPDSEAVGRFITQEVSRLDRFREALASGAWEEAKPMLEKVSYLTVDFPEADEPDRSAAVRLMAAAAFYAERWKRALAVLSAD